VQWTCVSTTQQTVAGETLTSVGAYHPIHAAATQATFGRVASLLVPHPHNYARLDTTAYSGTPSDSNSCADVLQTRPACVSISGNIIQGCKYRLEYIGCTRGICRLAVAEDAKKECMEPDMTGWEDENGTIYALFKNGTAYQKLAHIRGKEKSDFNLGSYFKENADRVTARSDGSQIARPHDSPTTKVQ
jgi:hypothetical protein